MAAAVPLFSCIFHMNSDNYEPLATRKWNLYEDRSQTLLQIMYQILLSQKLQTWR